MNSPIECQSCGRFYRADLLATCPGCAATSVETFEISQPSQTRNTYPTSREVTEVFDLERLIAAQNRTTHAVRAFVRFLFIQLSGLTAAGLVWYVSLLFIDQGECIEYGDKCDGNAFLQLTAIAIWIGTVIFSSNAAWSELGKSDIH
jgi:hypothetical protein